jgi:hypothetical protein
MADGWQTYPVEFRGGLITNLSPLQQGINLPGSARQLRNFEPSVEGGYRRINGFQKYSTTEVTGGTDELIRGILYFEDEVYAARNNAGVGEGELYKSSGAAWTRVSTDTDRFGANNNKIRFAKYNFGNSPRFIAVDGTNYPFKYNSTASTFEEMDFLPSDFQGCSHVIVYKDTLILANENVLLFGGFRGDDEQGMSVALGGGSKVFSSRITGMAIFRDVLYVFTETSIHSVAESAEEVTRFKFESVSADLGCIEDDTIQEIGGDVMFLGPDGLRLLSATDRIGDIGLGSVSRNIQSEATELVDRYANFCSIMLRKKSQYRIFGYRAAETISNSPGLIATQFSSQGGEDIGFAETRGIKAYTAYSEYQDAVEYVFFGNETGYVYRLEQGNSFDGEEIPATFFTPYLPIEDPTLRKTFYVIHNFIDPDGSFNASVSLNYDFGDADVIQPDPISLSNTVDLVSGGLPVGIYGEAEYGSGTVDDEDIVGTYVYGDAVRVSLRKQVTGSGFVVSFEYTSLGNTQPFTVDSVAIEFATESRR